MGKPTSREIRDIIKKYGSDRVVSALKTEVEDAKQNEASMIVDDGAEAILEYLLDEGMYSGKRLNEIIEEEPE
jgi:hypothetical protein